MNTSQIEYAVRAIECMRDDNEIAESLLKVMNDIKDILIEQSFMDPQEFNHKKVINFLHTINDVSLIIKYLSITTR